MVEKQKIKEIGKPWYDKDCLRMKNSLINALKTAKAKKWDSETRENYLKVKKKI